MLSLLSSQLMNPMYDIDLLGIDDVFDDPFDYIFDDFDLNPFRSFHKMGSMLDIYQRQFQKKFAAQQNLIRKHIHELKAQMQNQQQALMKQEEKKNSTESNETMNNSSEPKNQDNEDHSYVMQSLYSDHSRNGFEQVHEILSDSKTGVKHEREIRRIGDRWLLIEKKTEKDGQTISKETWHNVADKEIDEFHKEWNHRKSNFGSLDGNTKDIKELPNNEETSKQAFSENTNNDVPKSSQTEVGDKKEQDPKDTPKPKQDQA